MTSGGIRLADGVVYRAFGGQVLLLNLATGEYHGLNATARVMFEAVIERGETRGVAADLAARHQWSEADVAADLDKLCTGLAGRGLIEIGDLGTPAPASEPDRTE